MLARELKIKQLKLAERHINRAINSLDKYTQEYPDETLWAEGKKLIQQRNRISNELIGRRFYTDDGDSTAIKHAPTFGRRFYGVIDGCYPQPQGGELQGVHGAPDYGSFVDMALMFPDIKFPREFVEIVLFQLTCNPADCYNDDDCSVTHSGLCVGVRKFILERGYRDEYTGGDITEFLGY